MKKRKAVKKTVATKNKAGKSKAPRVLSDKQKSVQQALQITWLLKGKLKSAQMHFLKIGALLAQVRNEKLYAELKHPDMEDYARQRLNLGRSSLYNYLKIYDWVSKSHPEWLKPKPKGLIPDLSDIGDLIWIEDELARADIDDAKKASLKGLQKKALAGTLRRNEVRALRQVDVTATGKVEKLLASIKTIRKRAEKIDGLPSETLSYLDALIGIISNEKTLKIAGFRPFDENNIGMNEGLLA